MESACITLKRTETSPADISKPRPLSRRSSCLPGPLVRSDKGNRRELFLHVSHPEYAENQPFAMYDLNEIFVKRAYHPDFS